MWSLSIPHLTEGDFRLLSPTKLNDNLHVIKEELGKRHGKWNKENEDYIAI